MPRDTPTEVVINDDHARVDAPTARYQGAVTKLTGRTLTVKGRGFSDTYTFDDDPVVDIASHAADRLGRTEGYTIVGMVGGQPLTVVHDTGCKCRGSAKVMK